MLTRYLKFIKFILEKKLKSEENICALKIKSTHMTCSHNEMQIGAVKPTNSLPVVIQQKHFQQIFVLQEN